MSTKQVYPLPGSIWNHYKGGTYKVLTLANHSETNESMVIYKSIQFGTVFARPLKMWDEEIGKDGQNSIKRFELVLFSALGSPIIKFRY